MCRDIVGSPRMPRDPTDPGERAEYTLTPRADRGASRETAVVRWAIPCSWIPVCSDRALEPLR
jgi:hypothetical protein